MAISFNIHWTLQMTRTTELLKGCKGTLDYLTQDEVVETNGVCRENCLCDKCESELRGRLDALKELLSSKERHLKDLKECATNKIVGSWIWVNATIKRLTKQLASIQEEIKLIEGKI